MKPVIHPSTYKRFQEAAAKLNELRKRHDIATRLMWAGTLLLHFDDDELVLLNESYLSEMDRRLLARAGRPVRQVKQKKAK